MLWFKQFGFKYQQWFKWNGLGFKLFGLDPTSGLIYSHEYETKSNLNYNTRGQGLRIEPHNTISLPGPKHMVIHA